MKTSNQIRQEFLEFFRDKMHVIVNSAPVVPFDDPTLLFTNAGMNQFKDVFLGKSTREFNRLADTQKCIRVSGKHNDLEEVGVDTYHHTFFEMLGNWSFGDATSIDGIGTGYYKEEAIKWAWELLTEVWKLPKERLFATVYKTDDEAFNCWKTSTDINPSHILRFGEKDNFWEMGEVGPCGPCSEIHINLSENPDDGSLVNVGTPECIEIWNLVFIQFDRKSNGSLEPLKAKHVDTGMGFERLCAVIQGKKSNYDTDVFQPIIREIEKVSGKKYEGDVNQIAMRVIADHIRTLTFAITDGAFPGNEGRGYVLRRILRRASRFARKLDVHTPLLYKLISIIVENMGEVFPEIKSHQKQVEEIVKAEEESFGETLDRGLEIFESLAENLKKENKNVIPGNEAFKLYDTFGFPLDLTELMGREIGFSVDTELFQKLMEEQKNRSRESGKFISEHVSIKSLEMNIPNTVFTGYQELETKSKVLYSKDDIVVLDMTPFYAESGGQIGDKGELISSDKSAKVVDTLKEDTVFIHKLAEPVSFNINSEVFAKVDKVKRHSIMRNHSATHLTHAALRLILGEHVKQSGSLVTEERFRFDFTHYKKVESDELKAIEQLVNEKIRETLSAVHHNSISFDEAKKMGALMFFGDKYGDKVNVIQFGDFSREFCGGTHVSNTSEIGLVKIISEFSISSGVRRIEAVTGEGVEKYIDAQLNQIDQLNKKYDDLLEQKKQLEKEIAKFKLSKLSSGIDEILKSARDTNGIKTVAAKVTVDDNEQLKKLGDSLREKLVNGVGLLAAVIDNKVGLVCVVSDSLIKEKGLSAGKIVGTVAKLLGGGGGGKNHLATAGGKDVDKLDEALNNFESIIFNK